MGADRSPHSPVLPSRRWPATWPWDEVHWQELWTVVQWLGEVGQWRDVEGWQGQLDRVISEGDAVSGRRVWWVSGDHLGQGPFRWLVYGKYGELLAVSGSFHLPTEDGRAITVEVVLGGG